MYKFYYFIFIVLILYVSKLNGWVVQSPNVDNEITDEMTDDGIGQQRMQFIVPGTKWCGSGNISSNYDDLGRFKETDKCCRAHDYCDDVMEAGETKYNLTNHAFYTRLNCKCDYDFRDCLHNTESVVSNQVGSIYFNVLGTKCYRMDYPITGCKEYKNKRCLEYEFDTTGPKMYQWFDVPYY